MKMGLTLLGLPTRVTTVPPKLNRSCLKFRTKTSPLYLLRAEYVSCLSHKVIETRPSKLVHKFCKTRLISSMSLHCATFNCRSQTDRNSASSVTMSSAGLTVVANVGMATGPAVLV